MYRGIFRYMRTYRDIPGYTGYAGFMGKVLCPLGGSQDTVDHFTGVKTLLIEGDTL